MEDGRRFVLLLTLWVCMVCYCQSSLDLLRLPTEDALSLDENCLNCQGDCFNNTNICNGTCVSGFYGDGCELNCTSNCRYGCNRTSGSCNYCAKNYQGDYCNETCPQNCYSGCRQSGLCFGCELSWFGEKCNKTCPKNCRYGCDAETGECTRGCKPNFWGTESCNHTCPVNCDGVFDSSSCSQSSGACTNVQAGVYRRHVYRAMS
ncbi:cell death abnormality protein 1-like [Pecten maximus]|uniref:cell death abnormality protein 1-like n=1 Tax=Pecten maximus TaxID=6579 RepID=UPI001458EF8E|nr:cell death abnormality protein 1-like [Pecten maximus]